MMHLINMFCFILCHYKYSGPLPYDHLVINTTLVVAQTV